MRTSRRSCSRSEVPLQRKKSAVPSRGRLPWRLPGLRQTAPRPRRRELWLARRARGTALEVVEHEQRDRRRQISLLALSVDLANQLGQRHAALPGNLLHAIPECLFEAHASLVAGDHDRTLHDGRLHCASSLLTITQICCTQYIALRAHEIFADSARRTHQPVKFIPL